MRPTLIGYLVTFVPFLDDEVTVCDLFQTWRLLRFVPHCEKLDKILDVRGRLVCSHVSSPNEIRVFLPLARCKALQGENILDLVHLRS
jgi:hypothetical protein